MRTPILDLFTARPRSSLSKQDTINQKSTTNAAAKSSTMVDPTFEMLLPSIQWHHRNHDNRIGDSHAFYQWAATVSECLVTFAFQLPRVSHNALVCTHNGLLLSSYSETQSILHGLIYLKISLPIGCGYLCQSIYATTSIHGVLPPLFELLHMFLGLTGLSHSASKFQSFSSVGSVLVPILYWSVLCLTLHLVGSWGFSFLPTSPSQFHSLVRSCGPSPSALQIPVPFLFLLLGLIQCNVFCCNTTLCTLFPVHFLIWSISPHSNNCY
jgi:hypothetical protein